MTILYLLLLKSSVSYWKNINLTSNQQQYRNIIPLSSTNSLASTERYIPIIKAGLELDLVWIGGLNPLADSIIGSHGLHISVLSTKNENPLIHRSVICNSFTIPTLSQLCHNNKVNYFVY